MPNGKVGDHPFTDIVVHGRRVYSERADALIREIDARGGRERIVDVLWREFDEYKDPDIERLERFLLEVREDLLTGTPAREAPATSTEDLMRPYSRVELVDIRDEHPQRGHLCDVCGLRIPAFEDLDPETEARVCALIDSNHHIEAIGRLREAVGCSLAWAKLWVAHRGVPRGEVAPATPCPHCGKPLRTPRAKQCRHCRRQWHHESR